MGAPRRLQLHPRRDLRGLPALRGALEEARAPVTWQRILVSGLQLPAARPPVLAPTSAAKRPALLNARRQEGSASFKPPFPPALACTAKPTTINNTETFAAVPWIIRNGGGKFTPNGKPNNGGTKIFSVVGRCRKPATSRSRSARRSRPCWNWPAASEGRKAQGRDPGGSSARCCRRRHDGMHDGLRRHRQGRLDARVGRGDRDGRHARCTVKSLLRLSPLLPARVLRPVHAVPRRHRLAAPHGRPHRHGQGTAGRHGPLNRWPTTSRAAPSARWVTRRRCRCGR